MKVSIDYDQCMGEGACARVCPEVFAFDENALKGEVIRPDVPPDLEDKVREAADECGAMAVVITQ